MLRCRCVELKEAGWKQRDIATAFGLTEGWVSQTLEKHRELGPDSLLALKPPGSLPKLTPEQLSQLVKELNLGAVSHGFPGRVWTRSRVNELIGRLFGWYATAGELRPDAGRSHPEKIGVEFAETCQESPISR